MPAPLIGITTHGPHDPIRAELDRLLAQIVAGVAQAGGLPLLIPYGLAGEPLTGLLARIDGVLVSGGGDVDPARYGATASDLVKGIDAQRDAQEIAIARWAAGGTLPYFGICRGAQVLNAALGGTLYRDISEHAAALRHSYDDGADAARPHAVQIAEESQLAHATGSSVLSVNSLHHQAVRDLAPGLRAVAHAPDALIEAFESTRHSFVLGVQWHPEALLDDPQHLALFVAFVRAAGG